MSGSIQATISNTLTLQDVVLAEALRSKTVPELRAWLTAQQEKVREDITKQKEGTFDKTYGDFDRASKVEESILMHNKRAGELTNIVENVYTNQKSGAQAVLHDKDLASRKREMNEWSVGNKQDTLFVFSSLFLLLSGLLLITGLWRMGMISSVLWVAMGVPFLLIFLLVFVRRWRYTEVLRNKRYWNKQIFEGKKQTITMPTCEQLAGGFRDTANRLTGAAAGVGAAGAGAGAGEGAGA